MTHRIFLVFGLFLFVCISGMAMIHVVGSYLSCAFVEGCYAKLGVAGVMKTVSVNGIFVRGGLLAVAFTLLTWLNIRNL